MMTEVTHAESRELNGGIALPWPGQGCPFWCLPPIDIA